VEVRFGTGQNIRSHSRIGSHQADSAKSCDQAERSRPPSALHDLSSIGDDLTGVLGAVTSVVGKGRLKPRYVLGYHQGCYGYDTAAKCLDVARAYRENQFPIDGLHIDVDIQNDYRTFTIDGNKFPDARGMLQTLRDQGIRCSTNITPIISDKSPQYPVYLDGLSKGCFVPDQRRLSHPGTPPVEWHQNFGSGQQHWWSNENPRINSGQPYQGEVYYGDNPDHTPRGTSGVHPDFGQKAVRLWWGAQYQYLFETGLEMVWQDMTNPCIRDTRGDMCCPRLHCDYGQAAA
jgi:alpha-glucosidase